MTTKKIFVSYIMFSIILAWYFVSEHSTGALFGYDTLVNYDILLSGAGYLTLGLIFFFIGAYVSRFLFNNIKEVGSVGAKYNRRQNNGTSPSWRNFSLLFILAIYVFLFSTKFIAVDLFDRDSGRIFETKFSAFILLLLAYLGYLSAQYREAFLGKLVIVLISMFIIVFDASRSGIIPLIGMFFGAILMKKKAWALFIFYLICFGAAYSIGARNIDNRLSFDIVLLYLLPGLDIISELIMFSLDYFFAFSVLNFSYMSLVLAPDFSLTQLLLSINPLPSFVLGDENVDLIKLTGDVRAIGGPAELLLAGPAYFLSGFFLIGVLAGYVDTIIKSKFNFILLLFFSLITIVFFQYSLRTFMRVFEVMVFLTFYLRWKLKRYGEIN